MNLFQATLFSLNTCAFLYLAVFILQFISLARLGGWARKTISRISVVSEWIFIAAFILHTFGLIGRWVIGGIDRPPWTNLYESLIFFCWGLAFFHVIVQQKYRLQWLSAVTAPIVFVVMGMAALTSNQNIEPLIPSLQSYWLKIHVVFGMVAYGAFSLSACLGFLHLMRNGFSLRKISAGMALLMLLNLFIAGGSEFFTKGEFHLARSTTRVLEDGSKIVVKDQYREYEKAPIVTRTEKLKTAPWLLGLAFFLYSFIAVYFLWSSRKYKPPYKKDISSDQAFKQGYDLSGMQKGLLWISLLVFIGFIFSIYFEARQFEYITLRSNPYMFMLIFTSGLFSLMYMLVIKSYKEFLSYLPSAKRLAELSYKNILFAFPFQTLLLITGAVWAYSAWGRAWGWDPKEIGALVTWLVYLIYLHGKLLMNWKDNTLSILSLIGFGVMVFAFLGVNLVLSGLHSYGSA